MPMVSRTNQAVKVTIYAAILGLCLVADAAHTLRAQDVVYPGSTPQGDVLRGQGQFLKGRAMYELYSARGRQLDAQTAIAVENWNQEVYDAYMRERSARLQHRKNATKAQVEDAKRRMAETEERLRTHPTDADLVRGDALNALLLDLSDPSISSSSWRYAPVPLPEGISIRSLFFRFAPKLGDKSSGTLSGNLIALGRLDPGKGWPLFMPGDALGVEQRAYEAAHRRLLDQCEKGTLRLDAVNGLDAALLGLKVKVAAAVPTTRNYRAAAQRYVGDMQAATKIFDASTIDFAQEMIRDTHDYHPQTVGELLGFMRKYRLLFASAEGRPEDGEVYRRLYGLLRQQKEALASGPSAKPTADAMADRPPAPAAGPKPVKDELEDARTELMKLNFGRNPERGGLKRHAMQQVAVAIRDAGKGGVTKEPLEAALKDIESLQKEAKMAQVNRDYMKRASEKISAVIAAIR